MVTPRADGEDKKRAGARRLPPPTLKRRANQRQVWFPAGPLHLLLQHWLLAVQVPPFGVHEPQDGLPEQFESAQSMAPSQSLSTPSLQTSAVGVQPPLGARNGCTDVQ